MEPLKEYEPVPLAYLDGMQLTVDFAPKSAYPDYVLNYKGQEIRVQRFHKPAGTPKNYGMGLTEFDESGMRWVFFRDELEYTMQIDAVKKEDLEKESYIATLFYAAMYHVDKLDGG